MPKTMTIAELRAALAAKERQLAKLQAKRTGLAKQLGEIDQQIATLGGTGRRGPRKAPTKPVARRTMPKNVKPLIDYAKDVLAGAKDGMRVKDVMAAVQKAGYKTHSKDFYGQVAVMLRDKAFRKLGRGVYTLRSAGRGPKKTAKATAEAVE